MPSGYPGPMLPPSGRRPPAAPPFPYEEQEQRLREFREQLHQPPTSITEELGKLAARLNIIEQKLGLDGQILR